MARKGAVGRCEIKRRSVYWWSEEIGVLRESTIRARRRLTRFKTRNKGSRNEVQESHWRIARKGIRVAILEAKRRA